MPEGWPDLSGSDAELLAPLEACGTVAEYLALQERVEMAWLAEAKSERAGPAGARGGGVGPSQAGLAPLVDEAAGLTPEVVQARLVSAELEAAGPRLPRAVEVLERQQPLVEAPPAGVPEGYARWAEYVEYRQRRLQELKQGKEVEGPVACGCQSSAPTTPCAIGRHC